MGSYNEIAKKLIDENEKELDDLRRAEVTIRKRIAEYKHEIGTHELRIKNLRGAITMAEEDLQRVRDQKEEYLVDIVALKTFIAAGGETDMLD